MGDFPKPIQARASNPKALQKHFGSSDDLLPLWIAEPYLPVAPSIVQALEARATEGWYGYEVRREEAATAFRAWMNRRHRWSIDDALLLVSPSIGTSIGAALELVTKRGDSVVIQPPVFTDFKPLVVRAHRQVARNSLVLDGGRYTMDLDGFEACASEPDTTALILCNPHNPVGRVWAHDELRDLAQLCAANDIFVIADEIHADVLLGGSTFSPFARAAQGTGVRWAALHGPTKTFGLAGIADTLIITTDEQFAEGFKAMSSRLHLARNNVFSLACLTVAYNEGDEWLDGMLSQIEMNAHILRDELPALIDLVYPEGTYLAWLDFRKLNMDVPDLAEWLPREAKLALSPGHWFGREGAGFARMTTAVESKIITEAVSRLTEAIGRISRID